MKQSKKLFNMFWICVLIGSQMFESGMAVIPILQKEFIEKRKWITDEELLDIMSICKCTPGAYTVNVVTFIGNKYAGFWGGVMAAVGLTIVPIIAIIVFTAFYQYISEIDAIKSAMAGITVCVCCLIINSLIKLWKSAIVDTITLIIFIISFILYVYVKINIIIIILSMGCLNLLIEKIILPKVKKKMERE